MIRLALLVAAFTILPLIAADRLSGWWMDTSPSARTVVLGPGFTKLALVGAAVVLAATVTAAILLISTRPSGRTAGPEGRE